MTEKENRSTGPTASRSRPAARDKARPQRVLCRALLCVGAVCVALGLAEAGFRLFGHVTDLPLNFWDPIVGPRKFPGQEGRYRRGVDVDAPYHLNAQGWNYPEDYTTVKAPGTARVSVVGDSFVEALQVPYDQSFFAVSQRRMSRPNRPVKWYAFGQSGFGTTHEYLVIRHYVLDYSPDIVVMLFVANDLIDCSPYLARQEAYGPRFVLAADGGLTLLPAKYWHPSLLRRALAKSALVRYLYMEHGLFAHRRRPLAEQTQLFLREVGVTAAGDTAAVRALTPEERQQKTWQLIRALLERCRDECARRGAVFALAWYGSRTEVLAAEQNAVCTSLPRERDPWCTSIRFSEMGKEYLEPMARRLSIPYLDLTPALVEAARKTGRPVLIPHDYHYNARGHAAVGKALAQWLDTFCLQRWPSTASSKPVGPVSAISHEYHPDFADTVPAGAPCAEMRVFRLCTRAGRLIVTRTRATDVSHRVEDLVHDTAHEDPATQRACPPMSQRSTNRRLGMVADTNSRLCAKRRRDGTQAGAGA